MKKQLLLGAALVLSTLGLHAQSKLGVENVYSVYLQNAGTIVENNQIKGYFFLYQSDKIDRHTNEYTLQVLDQNLNKVKDIKFQDSKKVSLLEAAYNENSLTFLFKDEENKSLEMRVYDFAGKLKYTYGRDYDKRTEQLMKMYDTKHTDDGTNQNVFNVGEKGYVSVLPLRDGKQRTYEVDYYASQEKKQWAYVPDDDQEKYADAEFLGNTDSLIIVQVYTRKHMTSQDQTAHLVGINFVTKKKDFDLTYTDDEYKFVPTNVQTMPGTGKILLMGSYYGKNDNVIKDFSKGLAVYIMDSKGKTLSKTYNSWTEDFAKYLPLNSKGKIDKIGYLFIHKMIQTPNGKIFAVAEGYKRQADALGIAFAVLGAASGSGGSSTVTKMTVTDMVMIELNDKYKLTGAKIYDKTNNGTGLPGDYASPHALAMALKALGWFDYEFTTGEVDNSEFSVCYSDWERSREYRGKTFNTIHYNGSKFTTDKIELASKASSMKVLPAKAGSVMIFEYFKKAKKVEYRLEKLG